MVRLVRVEPHGVGFIQALGSGQKRSVEQHLDVCVCVYSLALERVGGAGIRVYGVMGGTHSGQRDFKLG